MKLKIQKVKFIRNIIIGIIALFIVACIIDIAPGFKRNKYQNVTNLVISDENVTEKLKNPIYLNEEKNIYISKEDMQTFFDKTFYYDEANNMIITTSEVSVASMKIGEKEIIVNSATNPTLYEIIYNNNIMYIPIEEMETVYNIDVQYVESENVVIIDKLNEGMIKAETEKETDIRFKPRGLSKKVGELKVGDTVSAFYTTSKGWRLIRTEAGEIGYVKANVLTNEYIVRQDMQHKTETKKVATRISDNTELNLEENKIIIKDLLKMTEEGILLKNVDFENGDENLKIWANLELENIELGDYENRAKLIKNIVTITIKNDIKGINIIPNEDENMQRFIIELAPRLREIGIKTNLVKNGNIDDSKYTDIVDYIIEEKV